MSTPLDDASLHAIADQRQLAHRVSDGVLRFGLSGDDLAPTTLAISAAAQCKNEIFVVAVSSSNRYHPSMRGVLLDLVNEFHDEHRWPMLVVDATDDGLTINAEHHHVLGDHWSTQGVGHVMDLVVRATIEFWSWMPTRLAQTDGAHLTDDDWTKFHQLLSEGDA